MVMVLDYSERKPVSKNRPRKQPGGFFVLLMVGAVGTAFVLGVITGWFTFRHMSRNSASKYAASAEVQRKGGAVPPPSEGQPVAGATGRPQEPSLTFYETLPRGGHAVIGSGLNPLKPVEHAPTKAAPPMPQTPAKPPPAAKPEEPIEAVVPSREAAKAPAKSPEPAPAKEEVGKGGDGKGKFVVQVASYNTKKDAEAMRDRLATIGVAAYIVESGIPDRGTWYRVRAGRHLDKQAAHDLAGKLGKGAIIIAE
jgi:cell division septation protein DedD